MDGGILLSELFWGRIFGIWSGIAAFWAQNRLKSIQNTLVQPIMSIFVSF